MARLRYNDLRATLNAPLTGSGTSITFTAALKYNGGVTNVPTIAAGDHIPLMLLDPATGQLREIVYLTAYTSGATTGTITRGQEGTTAVTHTSAVVALHAPTVEDFSSTWNSPSLPANWVNFPAFQGARYRRIGNLVHIQGLVRKDVSASAAQALLFTLPAGFRPPAALLFASTYYNGVSHQPARIDVETDGDVRVFESIPAAGYVSLNLPPFSID